MSFNRVLGLLLPLLIVVLPCSPLIINSTLVKWDHAVASCGNNGESLYQIVGVDDFENVTKQLDSSEVSTYWIGGKERRKFFFWNNDKSRLVEDAIGCFQSSFTLKQKFVENHPAMCISYCKYHRDMPYAALSGRYCICYPNILSMTAKQILDHNCNTTCPGDDNYICGSGNTSVTTVYDANESIKWKMFEPGNALVRDDCVLVTKDHTNQSTWFHVKCGSENKYICRIFDDTICQFKMNSNAPCLYMSPEQATWFEAVRKCANMGGHLVGKDILQETDADFGGSSFWTSLTRIRQRWIDNDKVSDHLPRSEELEPRRTGCLTLTKSSGEWRIQPNSCNETFPFLCSNEQHVRSDIKQAESLKKSMSSIVETVLGIAGAALVLLTILTLLVNFRKSRSHGKISEDPFYYILEKEPIYNTISLISSKLQEQVPPKAVTTKQETYYDCLAFEGTVGYSERLRSISYEADVQYRVYSRVSDVTMEYDVLQFDRTSSQQLADNYFTFSKEDKLTNSNINDCVEKTGCESKPANKQ